MTEEKQHCTENGAKVSLGQEKEENESSNPDNNVPEKHKKWGCSNMWWWYRNDWRKTKLLKIVQKFRWVKR